MLMGSFGVSGVVSAYFIPKLLGAKPTHRVLFAPSVETQVALFAWTGSVEMSVFQMLSGGKIAHLIAPPPVMAGVTVTSEVPVLVSQVAVMVALPAATPLTRPLPFTVACAVLS